MGELAQADPAAPTTIGDLGRETIRSIAQPREGDQGEKRPPCAGLEERDAHGHALGDTEGLMTEEEHEVSDEQDDAACVSHGPRT